MKQTERIEANRKATDLKNEALMKALYSTLDLTFNQISCYGDCESCVLGSKKENECLASDIGELENKILKFINVDEEDE